MDAIEVGSCKVDGGENDSKSKAEGGKVHIRINVYIS